MENGKLKKVRLADVPFHKRMTEARLACAKAKSVEERYAIFGLALHPGETVVTVRQ